MKTKLIYATIAAGFFCISIPMVCLAAESYGELNSITDEIKERGTDGVIVSTVLAVTSAEGQLALPNYKNSSLDSIIVVKGTLAAEPEEIRDGTLSYYLLQFAEPESEVELTLHWTQEDTYKTGKAKTKDTAPGSLLAVTYSMSNLTPINIGSYRIELAVPAGYELSSIVNYNPEDEYTIETGDQGKLAAYTYGSLKSGRDASLAINIKKGGAGFKIGMWGMTILVSAFFLYMNRQMLTEAKVLAAKQKTEKQKTEQ